MSTDTVDQNLHIYYGQDDVPKLPPGSRARSFVAFRRSIVTMAAIEIILGVCLILVGLVEHYSDNHRQINGSWDRFAAGLVAMASGAAGIAAIQVRRDSTGKLLFMAHLGSSLLLVCAGLGVFVFCAFKTYENWYTGFSSVIAAGIIAFLLFIFALFSTFASFCNLAHRRHFIGD